MSGNARQRRYARRHPKRKKVLFVTYHAPTEIRASAMLAQALEHVEPADITVRQIIDTPDGGKFKDYIAAGIDFVGFGTRRNDHGSA